MTRQRKSETAAPPREERQARLAEALRANLGKRKQQARARAEAPEGARGRGREGTPKP